MGPIAIAVLALTLAAAVASWVVAAVYGVRALAAIEGPDQKPLRKLALFAWPFAARRMTGAASAYAAVVNKAIVVFIVCIMIAAATVSLATNYNRFTAPRADMGPGTGFGVADIDMV